MNQQNPLPFDITGADRAEIAAAIDTLKRKLLPCLRSLRPEERMEMLKMGDKTSSFVHTALEHCTQNPELAPRFLDIDRFAASLEMVEYLRSVYAPLTQIADSVSDTMMLAGNDAYTAALSFYTAVRSAHRANVAKAGTIYGDLAARFPRRRRSRREEEDGS